MAEQKIYISDYNRTLLQELVTQGRRMDYASQINLNDLQALLRQAEVLPEKDLPKDVITLYSTARVRDLDTQREMTYTLVLPDDADPNESKVSVFSPVGMAIFGQREGSSFEWRVPDGVRRLRVEEVLHQVHELDPNEIAEAADTFEEEPYPERRRPMEDEMTASEDSSMDVQEKWETGYSPSSKETREDEGS